MRNYDLSLLLANKYDADAASIPLMSPPSSLPSVLPFNTPPCMSPTIPYKHTLTTTSVDEHLTATN